MKKKFNISNLFKIYKENVTFNLKFYFLTKLVPFAGISYVLYNCYTYNFFSFWKTHVFSVQEEKQISKKIFPLLKYKNIENIYDDKSSEHKVINDIYKSIIKHMKINLKHEIFLIKSDLNFLYLLSNGSLFISDTFYYSLENDKRLLAFFIINSIFHLKNRHTDTNLKNIYSRIDLIKQYHNLCNGEIGYEHYFMNYYLYLPFSKNQEYLCITETLKLLNEMNLISKDEVVELVKKVDGLLKKMKKFSTSDIDQIKEKLSLSNKRVLNNTVDNLKKEYKKLFDESKFNKFLEDNYLNLKFYDEKDDICNKVIYGDFIHKNENVEVFLHQRTMKKIKYKKREYDFIHPIDSDILNKIVENKNNIFN